MRCDGQCDWFVAGGAALSDDNAGCATGPADTGNADDRRPRLLQPLVRPNDQGGQGKTGHLIEPGPAAELGYRISWARDDRTSPAGSRITSVGDRSTTSSC